MDLCFFYVRGREGGEKAEEGLTICAIKARRPLVTRLDLLIEMNSVPEGITSHVDVASVEGCRTYCLLSVHFPKCSRTVRTRESAESSITSWKLMRNSPYPSPWGSTMGR